MLKAKQNKKNIFLISLLFLFLLSTIVLTSAQVKQKDVLDDIGKIPIQERIPNDILSKTPHIDKNISLPKNISDIPQKIKISKEVINHKNFYGNDYALIQTDENSTIDLTTAIINDRYISVKNYNKSTTNTGFNIRMYVGTNGTIYSIYKSDTAELSPRRIKESGYLYANVISQDGYIEFKANSFSAYIAGLPDWYIPLNNQYKLNLTNYASGSAPSSTEILFTNPDTQGTTTMFDGDTKTNSKFKITLKDNYVTINSTSQALSGTLINVDVCGTPFSSCQDSQDSFLLSTSNQVPNILQSLSPINLNTNNEIIYYADNIFALASWTFINVTYQDPALNNTAMISVNRYNNEQQCTASNSAVRICLNTNAGQHGASITIDYNSKTFNNNISFIALNDYYNLNTSLSVKTTSTEGGGQSSGAIVNATVINDTNKSWGRVSGDCEWNLQGDSTNWTVINGSTTSCTLQTLNLGTSFNGTISQNITYYQAGIYGYTARANFTFFYGDGTTAEVLGADLNSDLGNTYVLTQVTNPNPTKNVTKINIKPAGNSYDVLYIKDIVYFVNITSNVSTGAKPYRIPFDIAPINMSYLSQDYRTMTTYWGNFTSINITIFNSTSGANITKSSLVGNEDFYNFPEFNLSISSGDKRLTFFSKTVEYHDKIYLKACNSAGCNDTSNILGLDISGILPYRNSINHPSFNLTLALGTSTTFNLSSFWNYESSLRLSFVNILGNTINLSTGQSYSDDGIDVLMSLTNEQVTIVSRQVSQTLNLRVTAVNGAGTNSDDNSFIITIGSSTGTSGFVNYFLSIFPDSSTLSFGARMVYVFLSIAITITALLLGAYFATGTIPPAIGWISLIFAIIEFIYFVSIGYIPVGWIIAILLVLSGLAFFRFRSGGGG